MRRLFISKKKSFIGEVAIDLILLKNSFWLCYFLEDPIKRKAVSFVFLTIFFSEKFKLVQNIWKIFKLL